MADTDDDRIVNRPLLVTAVLALATGRAVLVSVGTLLYSYLLWRTASDRRTQR